MVLLKQVGVAVVSLAVLMPAGAMAAGPGGHGEPAAPAKKVQRSVSYIASGSAVSSDAAAGKVTVSVKRANHHARSWKGKDVVVVVSTATKLTVKVPDRNADGKVDLADVQSGDRVRLTARAPRKQVPAADAVSVKRLTILAPAGK